MHSPPSPRLPLSASTRLALRDHYLALNDSAYAALALKTLRAGADPLEALAGHPLADDWLDFHHCAVASYLSARTGFLYLLAHPSIPNLYKVGLTQKGVSERIKSLSTAGVVGRFALAKSWAVPDCHALEAAAHRALSDRHRHKEFFEGTWQELATVIDHVVLTEVARLSLFTGSDWSSSAQ